MRSPGISKAVRLIVRIAVITGWVIAVSQVRVHAFSGDTVADREVGQPDFFHNAANTPDADVFNNPNQIAIDRSVTPNRLYVADSQNSRVLGYHSVAALVTGARADLVIGQRDLYSAGCNNPVLSQSSLCTPSGVAVDTAGNVYVADGGNSRVLRFANPFVAMAATGVSANFPANLVLGQVGNFRTNPCNQPSGTPTAANLCNPTAVALYSHNNLFVSDTGNSRVLEYNAPLASTSAGAHVFGQLGSFVTGTANKGGISASSLNAPRGIALDPVSNALYIADNNNSRVLKFNTPLTSQTANLVFGQSGLFNQNNCNIGGPPSANLLCGGVFTFISVSVDALGNVYITDFGNNRLLIFNPPIAANPKANLVLGQSTFAVNGCNQGLPPSAKTLCAPAGAAVDSSKNLWVSDLQNNRLLRFTPPFSNDLAAAIAVGQPDFIHNAANSVDREGMNNPSGIAVDRSVLPNHLFVADFSNSRILGYNNAAAFANNAPADLVIGQADFYSGTCNRGGAIGANTLCNPRGIALASSGALYVVDYGNNRVLGYGPPFKSGLTTNQAAVVVLGQPNFTTHFSATSRNGLSGPSAAVFDSQTKLYVVDEFNNRVLQFIPPYVTNQNANLVFGQATFTAGACNRNVATNAGNLCVPLGAAVDAAGNLYVADSHNNRVVEYNTPLAVGEAAARVFGHLGSFTAGGCNDIATGLNADSLCNPQGVALDTLGNLYIADSSSDSGINNRVLEYNTPLKQTGVAGSGDTTADRVFGQADDFYTNLCNFGGAGPSPNSLCNPVSIALDTFGDLYISDYFNNRVVEYDVP